MPTRSSLKAQQFSAADMLSPIRRKHCADKKPMTPQRILDIIARTGEFAVTWHYREDNLRKRCREMAQAGLLKQKRCEPGRSLFVAPRVNGEG